MKDLTCLSLSDSTILIVSTTDSGNVYAMSVMVQRKSSWNGLQGMRWEQFVHSFWSLSENAYYLCCFWYWLYEDGWSSFISFSNWHKILHTSGPHISHRIRTDSSSRLDNPDSPPWPLMILLFCSCSWSRAIRGNESSDLDKINDPCVIWWYTSGWMISSEIKSKTWVVIQRE